MEEIELTEKLFGSTITIIVYETEEEIAKPLLLEAYEEALRLQKIFNYYDEESEINILNKERILQHPSPELIELLQVALDMTKKTKGKYDLTHGENYKQRKRGEELTKLGCSADDIHIEEGTITLTHEQAQLDFGSLAKGYITDKIAAYLQQNGIETGLINARGDILVFGNITEKIIIQNPRGTEPIGEIAIENSAVATSGDYEQNNGNYDENHIIGNKDYASATVTAPNLTQADLYATVLLLVGEEETKNIMKENQQLKALCITKNSKIQTYNNFETLQTKDEVEEHFKGLHKNKKTNTLGPVGNEEEDTREIQEWYIDEEGFPDEGREIFVRPGNKQETQIKTKAS